MKIKNKVNRSYRKGNYPKSVVIKCSIDYTDYTLHEPNAIISFTGMKEYYDGSIVWFIGGQPINCSSKEEFEKMLALKAFW